MRLAWENDSDIKRTASGFGLSSIAYHNFQMPAFGPAAVVPASSNEHEFPLLAAALPEIAAFPLPEQPPIPCTDVQPISGATPSPAVAIPIISRPSTPPSAPQFETSPSNSECLPLSELVSQVDGTATRSRGGQTSLGRTTLTSIFRILRSDPVRSESSGDQQCGLQDLFRQL